MATANWNTLHIFGFGQIQVIAKDGGASKDAKDLQSLQAVIDNVWSFESEADPSPVPRTKEYHAINIFEGMFADWQAKTRGEKGYRVEFKKLDAVAIQALIDEVLAPAKAESKEAAPAEEKVSNKASKK